MKGKRVTVIQKLSVYRTHSARHVSQLTKKRLQKVSCICLVSYLIRFQPQTGYYALTFSLLNVVAMNFSTVRVYQIIVQKTGRIPCIADKASTIKGQHKQTEGQTEFKSAIPNSKHNRLHGQWELHTLQCK